jgi:IS30 family transposase
VQALQQLPPRLRRSLTWDQGSEMARHAEITQILGMPVFFSRQGQPVAAAQQRKHQRAAAPVLP